MQTFKENKLKNKQDESIKKCNDGGFSFINN